MILLIKIEDTKMKKKVEKLNDDRNFVAKAMFENGNEFSCKVEPDKKKELKKGKTKHKVRY